MGELKSSGGVGVKKAREEGGKETGTERRRERRRKERNTAEGKKEVWVIVTRENTFRAFSTIASNCAKFLK